MMFIHINHSIRGCLTVSSTMSIKNINGEKWNQNFKHKSIKKNVCSCGYR